MPALLVHISSCVFEVLQWRSLTIMHARYVMEGLPVAVTCSQQAGTSDVTRAAQADAACQVTISKPDTASHYTATRAAAISTQQLAAASSDGQDADAGSSISSTPCGQDTALALTAELSSLTSCSSAPAGSHPEQQQEHAWLHSNAAFQLHEACLSAGTSQPSWYSAGTAPSQPRLHSLSSEASPTRYLAASSQAHVDACGGVSAAQALPLNHQPSQATLQQTPALGSSQAASQARVGADGEASDGLASGMLPEDSTRGHKAGTDQAALAEDPASVGGLGQSTGSGSQETRSRSASLGRDMIQLLRAQQDGAGLSVSDLISVVSLEVQAGSAAWQRRGLHAVRRELPRR